MRYELMFPAQIRHAVAENWPAVLPVGVLEYHDEHNVVGVDTLVVVRAVEALETEMNLVILPPFHYGVASYAVAPPEEHGTVQISADTVHRFARDLFDGLLRIGFRNLHLFIHHQTENIAAGMPTDLALRLAAREAIFAFLERQHGEGWWGEERMKGYYEQHATGSDPFNWIKVHPLMDAANPAYRDFQGGHADKIETSLMMAFCPEGVDMRRFTPGKWYAQTAPQASLECGRAVRDAILQDMRRKLGKG